MIDRGELSREISAFIDRQDDDQEDSWYTTNANMARVILEQFERFLFAKVDAKESRRKLFEQLKKEFENEGEEGNEHDY